MTTDILSRYRQAQAAIQGIFTNKFVRNDAVFPHWIDNTHCFWYKRETKEGKEFRLVDAEAASNSPAFDHQILATELTKITGKNVDYQDLPLSHLTMSGSPLRIRFQAFGKHWLFEPENAYCQELETQQQCLHSPDGKKAVYTNKHNLYLRDQATSEELALTNDGTANNSYARSTIPSMNSRVQALWSPNSKRIITVQLDTRNVSSRIIVEHVPMDGSLHPRLAPILSEMKFAYPGDKHIESYQLVAIDVASGQVTKADYPTVPVPACNVLNFFGDKPMGWWSSDNRRAFFVDVSRGAKAVRVVEFNTDSGSARVLFEETSDTFVKLSHTALEPNPLFLPLPESNELIWFSERTDWGHIYLYNLNTGELKHPITEGEWIVRDILQFDADRRELILQTAGRDQRISPYYRDICKVNIDTGELTPLVSGNFEYLVYRPYNYQVTGHAMMKGESADVNGVAPNGQYLVTTRSRVDLAPVSVLIDRNGVEILTLETMDTSSLPSDWQWPEPVKLKSDDGHTDIYGVIYRPPGFSPDKRYPVVDFSCGMRHHTCVPQGSFVNAHVHDMYYLLGAAIAALGFIVVAIEGRGTPHRNKTFQDYNYGDIASASAFSDRIAGLHQLAEHYPYLDLERVGITAGDSLGNTIYGMLDYPDFYKVGVIFCHADPRFDYAPIAETYDGIPFDDNAVNPQTRYAEDYVDSLKGELLLIEGMLDPTIAAGTFRLVEALQNANKDFDLICMPSKSHDVPTYGIRRSWDFLVKHLQGIKPPHEFPIRTGFDLLVPGTDTES